MSGPEPCLPSARCRLVEVLRRAAASVKKEQKLPPVALGMLRLALEEDKFPQFWKQVVEQGLLQKQLWPVKCVYPWVSLPGERGGEEFG